MIYLINNINSMIVGEFTTMAQVREHLRSQYRFTVENSYLIDGKKKNISTAVTYRVDGEKAVTLPLEDYKENHNEQAPDREAG